MRVNGFTRENRGYLMLPVPVRIVSTYQVISVLGWVDTYWGLTVPLMASATGTFLFRQFFLTIPDSLAEAAQLDGAGPIRRFFAITFPLLSPVTFFLFTLNMTFSFFDTFGLIHSVTQGGPGDATSIMVYRAWKDGFDGLQLGFSAAQSVILMILVITLTAFQFRYAEKKVTY